MGKNNVTHVGGFIINKHYASCTDIYNWMSLLKNSYFHGEENQHVIIVSTCRTVYNGTEFLNAGCPESLGVKC